MVVLVNGRVANWVGGTLNTVLVCGWKIGTGGIQSFDANFTTSRTL